MTKSLGTFAAAALALAASSHAFAEAKTLFPEIADTSHASPQARQFFHSFFTAKSRHKPAETMKHFSQKQITYIDATLGWPFYDFTSLSGVFEQFMPTWRESGKSYPTRILGDTKSALVAFTDTPELFGGEIRILAAIDFRDGKVIRWIDYWDGRHFGAATAAKMRTPEDKFPKEFSEKAAGENASAKMRAVADKLAKALAGGDAAAASSLFTYDAVYEDMTLRTQVLGRMAIKNYLARAAAKLPYGQGAELAHVVGSDQGGGYEWRAAPAYAANVKRGVTALELDRDGQISRFITVWDGSVVSDADILGLAALSIEK